MAGLALGSAAGAQEQPAGGAGIFGEVVDVRVVNIEVVVTDRDGVPVRGLGPGDFVLEVDGAEVPIGYFTEVRSGKAVETGGGGQSLASIPALAPGDPLGTSYLLFVDDFFSLQPDRDKVLGALEAQLPLLGPQDRMAIVAFDGRKLEMLSSWSRSVPELARALAKGRERGTSGLQRLAERRQFESNRAPIARVGGFRNRLDPEARAYALRLGDQVATSVQAASATLRAFAMPPGRKVMLLLAGGWPYSLTDFVTGNSQQLLLENDLVEGADLFQQLTDTANLLGYTLYPVSVPGSVERFEDVTLAGAAASVRGREIRASYTFMAHETGGRAFLGADRLEAFQSTVSDTRSFYWLGFSPQRAWDDRRHEVTVRTRNPALRVRSRRSFKDSSHGAEVSMAVESAMLFGNPLEESPVEVSVGAGSRAGFHKSKLPVTISVPFEALTLLPQADGLAAQLEVRFAVQDESFHTAEIPVIPILLRAQKPPAPGSRWRYETSLKIRRKPHRLMVAVYDVPSGRILTRGIDLDP